MNVHAFIFNWKNHFERACKLEDQIAKFVHTTVINSEETPTAIQKHWQHLGDTAYFAAQWNRALELFRGDLLFHVQADADIEDVGFLIERATIMIRKHNLGVYEPNIDYTDIQYRKARLHALAGELMLVPRTDCTCWFVRGDVLRRFLPINLTINHYGWGVDLAVAAQSYLMGRRVVRDYSILVKHPHKRTYPTSAALDQMRHYIQTFNPAMERIAMQLFRESVRLSEA